MPKKPRAERKWKRRRELKSKVLLDMRQRLIADVGPYFAVAQTRRCGFWALIRMLFPVVEAASKVIYPVSGRERSPVRLLRDLGFSYPNLVLEMYRHTLMHNDVMAVAEYRGRRIQWAISIGGTHHEADGQLCVDAKQLYDDLLALLAHRAAAAGSTQTWISDAFRFNTKFARATRDEALRLGRK